jgi:hypothetical protein
MLKSNRALRKSWGRPIIEACVDIPTAMDESFKNPIEPESRRMEKHMLTEWYSLIDQRHSSCNMIILYCIRKGELELF